MYTATEPAFTGGIGWGLHMLTDIAFRWIPATITVMTGSAPDTGVPTPLTVPITEPITTSDVVHFLQFAGAPGTYEGLAAFWGLWVALSVVISLLLAAASIYSIVRLLQVRHNEEQRFLAASQTVAAQDVSKTQLRWNRVLEQAHSTSDQHWRLAILEADIMLNELLDVLGYRGETMADKMKSVARGDFKTIDLAWEAHKVRNSIAHQGSMHHLSAHETSRVIGLYRQVFREFQFVE